MAGAPPSAHELHLPSGEVVTVRRSALIDIPERDRPPHRTGIRRVPGTNSSFDGSGVSWP